MFEVSPGDADLEVVEALREVSGPVLLKNFARVNLGGEELGDSVTMNGAAGIVGHPLPLVDVEFGLALGAGPVERAILPREDDLDLLSQLDRELLLQGGPGAAGRALHVP